MLYYISLVDMLSLLQTGMFAMQMVEKICFVTFLVREVRSSMEPIRKLDDEKGE